MKSVNALFFCALAIGLTACDPVAHNLTEFSQMSGIQVSADFDLNSDQAWSDNCLKGYGDQLINNFNALNKNEQLALRQKALAKSARLVFKNASVAERISGEAMMLELYKDNYYVGEKTFNNTIRQEILLDKSRNTRGNFLDELTAPTAENTAFEMRGFLVTDNSTWTRYRTYSLAVYDSIDTYPSQLFTDSMMKGYIVFNSSKAAASQQCSEGINLFEGIIQGLNKL